MGIWITAAIVLIVTVGATVCGYILLTRKAGGGSKVQLEEVLTSINAANSEISELLKSKDSFIGVGQFEFVQRKRDELNEGVAKERENLKAIEVKLDSAQKMVEQKEVQQQEIKAAKEEDLIRLQELLVNYDDFSRESIELEQKLALSLKNLDSILNELEMTTEQREVFGQLQAAVEEGGSRLRDLLTEYQAVHERLTMLRQQHSDLEEEYTRLVEQQLGE